MAIAKIRPTKENLDNVAAPMIARWLIDAVQNRGDLTYKAAMLRLEADIFTPIGRGTKLGRPAATLMDRIHAVAPDAPLLNSLLVMQNDRMPSTGIRYYFADRFGRPQLKSATSRVSRNKLWRETFNRAVTEVYAFQGWPEVYEQAFGEAYRESNDELAPRGPNSGTEKDGLPRGRSGEGPHHRALRLWVKANPATLFPTLAGVRAETEVDLDSGDRVDVVYYHSNRTIALEVKSMDSNVADLRRGVFQCIKYLAVISAMDPRPDKTVESYLVTETPLPGDLVDIARLNGIRHRLVPTKRSEN